MTDLSLQEQRDRAIRERDALLKATGLDNLANGDPEDDEALLNILHSPTTGELEFVNDSASFATLMPVIRHLARKRGLISESDDHVENE